MACASSHELDHLLARDRRSAWNARALAPLRHSLDRGRRRAAGRSGALAFENPPPPSTTRPPPIAISLFDRSKYSGVRPSSLGAAVRTPCRRCGRLRAERGCAEHYTRLTPTISAADERGNCAIDRRNKQRDESGFVDPCSRRNEVRGNVGGLQPSRVAAVGNNPRRNR